MRRLSKELQIFIITVILGASALLWALSWQIPDRPWWELLFFMVLIGFATMFPIPDPRGGYLTVTPVLLYVLLSVHGPAAALVVAGFAGPLGLAISTGWQPWRVIFNGAQIGISVSLAALVFRAVGGSLDSPSILTFFIPFTLAAITHQLTNNFLVAFGVSRLRKLPLMQTWIADIKDFMWSNLLSVPTAALFAILYKSVHPLVLLLYLASLPLQRWALQLYLQQRRIYSQAIDSLVVAIDANFPQGKGHSRRVADLAVAIARQLNLADSTVESIELGALLHDVGLIGLDEALESHRALDPSGLVRLREHATIGAEIAREIPRRDVAEIVQYHHEKYDGTGYPTGLKGNRIPLGARIVAAAEVFDSIFAGGFPYSQARSLDEIITYLKQESGKSFDSRVINALIAAVESGVVETMSTTAEPVGSLATGASASQT